MTSLTPHQFQDRVLDWYEQHGRKHLPWQQPATPYHVWLSEIMLQQTQVATVIDYFKRFITELPDVIALANAHEDTVLHLWSGLGYYARARNLHKTAKIIRDDYVGEFPADLQKLQALPGIGRSTAGAIYSLAFQQSAAILDGNVKRVFARFFGIEGWPGQTTVLKKFWALAESYKSQQQPRAYSQVLMDLGATICTRSQAQCDRCPLQTHCQAFIHQRVNDLPTRKPRKKIPAKTAYFIIFINEDQQLLLQKRPPAGIWGGLWCFPQLDNDHKTTIQQLATQTGVKLLQEKSTLPSFRHTFSHFHLDITPMIWRVKTKPQHVNDDALQQWYTLPLSNIGLAKPTSEVVTLLGNI